MNFKSLAIRLARFILSACVPALLVACGRSSGSHTIGGTVSGLSLAASLTLVNNGGDAIVVNTNGTFTFPSAVSGSYAVAVSAAPATQTCSVSGGSGNATTNITNIQVNCVTHGALFVYTANQAANSVSQFVVSQSGATAG